MLQRRPSAVQKLVPGRLEYWGAAADLNPPFTALHCDPLRRAAEWQEFAELPERCGPAMGEENSDRTR